MEPVQLKFSFKATALAVFDAWTKPEIMNKWLFNGPTSEIINTELHLKNGGGFSILELEETNNAFIDHFGKYREILKPSKLIFTLSVPKHFEGETLVNILIESTSEGCEMTFVQTGVDKSVTEKNWIDMFKKLKKIVDGK